MILRILGCLLLVAATLKILGMAVEPVGAAGWFSQPWVQTVVVEWEIILGLWLLWGQHRGAALFAVTATFLTFAFVSFRQGWIGQTSCGCFGAIRVNPWLAFGIDIAALALLATVGRKAVRSPAGQVAKSFGFLATSACGVLAMLGLLAGIGTLAFGSPAGALAYLRGEKLSVEPRLLDMGEGCIGDNKEAVVHVRNWTDQPIRVLGGTSDCSCVVTRSLPVTIPPGERMSLTVVVRLKGPPGLFTRTANLFTDHDQTTRVAFRLSGRTTERPTEHPLAHND